MGLAEFHGTNYEARPAAPEQPRSDATRRLPAVADPPPPEDPKISGVRGGNRTQVAPKAFLGFNH